MRSNAVWGPLTRCSFGISRKSIQQERVLVASAVCQKVRASRAAKSLGRRVARPRSGCGPKPHDFGHM